MTDRVDMGPVDLDRVDGLCEQATPAPWHTVGPPWRPQYREGLPLPTFVISGSNDPHAGTPVCDGIAIDEWEDFAHYNRMVAQSDHDLVFIAASRTLVPEMAFELRAARARIAELEAIVARLDCTEDGVPVTPGVRLWGICHSGRVFETRPAETLVLSGDRLATVWRHYSTREAALAAVAEHRRWVLSEGAEP